MQNTYRWMVVMLSLSYALASTSASLTVFPASLFGIKLAPNPAWATLPLTLQLLGTMVAGFPASMLMKRIGRRNGFLLGTSIGFTGSMLSAWAIMSEHFGVFYNGIFMLG